VDRRLERFLITPLNAVDVEVLIAIVVTVLALVAAYIAGVGGS
jgi:hypothetical protein